MSDAMKFKRGMHGYACLLRCVILAPSTTEELAALLGVQCASVSMVMRRFHAQGIVHVESWVPGTAAYKMPAERWAYGAGKDAPAPELKAGGARKRIVSKARVPVKVEAYTFGLIVKALEEGHSVRALCELLGLHRRGLAVLITLMRSIKLVHIGGWDSSGNGCPAAIYRIGDKPNARRPKPTPTVELNRRYREKRAQRMVYPDLHRAFAQQASA